MTRKINFLIASIALVATSAKAQQSTNTFKIDQETVLAMAPITEPAKTASTSLLMLKIEQGHLIDAKEMIMDGTDIFQVNQQGQTALHYAARKGYIELVKKLLKSGADANLRDANGKTALDITCETKYRFPHEQRVITRLLTKATH